MNTRGLLILFVILSSHILNCFAQESWTPTDTLTAPTARWIPTSVWTGTKMIVWGGRNDPYSLNTGGSYDPVTNHWTAISVVNAPPGAYWNTAIWTGSAFGGKMIVWGGSGNAGYLNSGGIYDPTTDSWTLTSTSAAPSSRENHTAIWTGSKMIIWGGLHNGCENTGGIYDPSSDSWTQTSLANAPAPRYGHSAIWTGTKMIIWGGLDCYSGYLNTGGIYNPLTDSWLPTSTVNVPSARYVHSAVWTGNKMIVWGGDSASSTYLKTGGIYDPVTNTWNAMDTNNAPAGRIFFAAVWTGTRMIVWGGLGNSVFNTGGIYDPVNNLWTVTTTLNAPQSRCYHTGVWTGTRMIVWGGSNSNILKSGGVYFNPAVIGIERRSENIPVVFSLSQNFPNPFNPVTKFKFDLPKDGNVTIEVFDVIGRVVATLAYSEFKRAGTYEVTWDASDVSSGIYFYRLVAGDPSKGSGQSFVATRKMVLVK